MIFGPVTKHELALAVLGSAGIHMGAVLCFFASEQGPVLTAPPPNQPSVVHTRAVKAAVVSEVTVPLGASQPLDPGYSPPANDDNTLNPEAISEPTFPAQPDYWPRKWLSTAPAPQAPTVVPYPEATSSHQREGWVILELFISSTGHVDKIEVLSSDATDEFIESARQTFLQAIFTPGLKDSTPVPSRIKIEVRYE